MGIYKPREKKENIISRTDNSAQSSNYRKLEKNYAKAIEIYPEDAGAYIELARLHRIQGKCKEAAEMYEKAAEIKPRNAWHILN